MLKVLKGERPPRPVTDREKARGLTDDTWSLIQRCWAQNPDERPTMTGVVNELLYIRAKRQNSTTFSSIVSRAHGLVPCTERAAFGPRNAFEGGQNVSLEGV